ncbi:MAG: winged helix-turn-helix transcriptional regulator [Candidatus Bathyarchaeota archaeon]|jgi:DNA-binding Lrp family transcriptional regulator|nr:winged helix-turn-helix transcriptional regulator [Candidatus Bathyarchaeota archaeon]
MKQEKLLKLLFELIENSKRSDRDLAKILNISQPTITRLRKVLEKQAIQQYTIIPNLTYLGFDLVAFTFCRTKELVHPLWDKGREWAKEQPNVVFVCTGQGMDADALMVSVHKDYGDFVKFYHIFRRDWGKYLEDFKIFLVSLSGSVMLKHFTFNHLIEAYQKANTK